MAQYSSNLTVRYNSFTRDVTANSDGFLPRGFFNSNTNRFSIILIGATTSIGITPYLFRFSTGLNLKDVEDFSFTFFWGDDNELTFDFADYSDRTDPYEIRPSDTAIRAKMDALYRWVIAGNTQVRVFLENNPRVTALGITAESDAGTGVAGVQESTRGFSWEWDISSAVAGTTRWANIGVTDDTDDIVIPDVFLRESGAGSFNRIRSRANQLRISLVGDNPRLSPAFEKGGTIWIQNPDTGEILATIKDIASFWNNANNQYRITTDEPFLSGSRSELRTEIRNVGVGESLRFVLSSPPAGLEIYSASELGAAAVGLSAPKLEISPRSEPGTGLVNVEKIPDLRIRARSGLAIASGDVLPATNLGITGKSLTGSAGANLASQAIKILARSLSGTAGVSAEKPTNILLSVKSEPGTARVKPAAPSLKILARSMAGTGEATVEDNKGLRISRRARRGTASVNLVAPNIKALSRTGQGTSRIRLTPPKLKIDIQGAGAVASVTVEKQTKLFLSALSGTGAAKLNLSGSYLGIRAQSLAGTSSADVKKIPDLRIRAQSLAGTSSANVAKKTKLFLEAKSGTGTAVINIRGVATIAALARTQPGTATANVKFQSIFAGAQTRQGTAFANIEAPTLSGGARSRRGRSRIRIIAPTLSGRATTLSGTAQARLSPLKIKSNPKTRPGTASVSAKRSLRIIIKGNTESGVAIIKLISPKLEAMISSGVGSGSINVIIPERPRDRIREALVEGQPTPGTYSVTVPGGVYSRDAIGGIYGVKAVK